MQTVATRSRGSSGNDGRELEIRCPFPGTPQISTLLNEDQPARREPIVRSYASGFSSASESTPSFRYTRKNGVSNLSLMNIEAHWTFHWSKRLKAEKRIV
ncbi:hypothetical protein V1477_001217 [Vespula maculifrons]|uniref:Uncharacterized protein n=2 Tax=Vespula TaxID=7451 RepID=A0ABD2A2M2_VESSQ